MEKKNQFFQKALTDFIQEFADGGAIRRLADQGLSVPQIGARLDYPLPEKKIAGMVWKHYLETGRIRLTPPEEEETPMRRVRYVREQGAYGRSSMRQVVETVPQKTGHYLECDFGRQIWKDRDGFLEKLAGLPEADREYVTALPWPLQKVWHLEEDRIRRILAALGN